MSRTWSKATIVNFNMTVDPNDIALLKAVVDSKVKLIRLLIEGGADVDVTNDDGQSALMAVCLMPASTDENSKSKQVNMVTNLLSNGADTNMQDKYGKTCLMYACARNCHIGLIKKLLDVGADPSLEDRDGFTAMKYAAEHNNITTLDLLAFHCRALGKQIIVVTLKEDTSGNEHNSIGVNTTNPKLPNQIENLESNFNPENLLTTPAERVGTGNTSCLPGGPTSRPNAAADSMFLMIPQPSPSSSGNSSSCSSPITPSDIDTTSLGLTHGSPIPKRRQSCDEEGENLLDTDVYILPDAPQVFLSQNNINYIEKLPDKIRRMHLTYGVNAAEHDTEGGGKETKGDSPRGGIGSRSTKLLQRRRLDKKSKMSMSTDDVLSVLGQRVNAASSKGRITGDLISKTPEIPSIMMKSKATDRRRASLPVLEISNNSPLPDVLVEEYWSPSNTGNETRQPERNRPSRNNLIPAPSLITRSLNTAPKRQRIYLVDNISASRTPLFPPLKDVSPKFIAGIIHNDTFPHHLSRNPGGKYAVLDSEVTAPKIVNRSSPDTSHENRSFFTKKSKSFQASSIAPSMREIVLPASIRELSDMAAIQ